MSDGGANGANPKRSLPVTWGSGDVAGGPKVQGSAEVVTADEQDVSRFGHQMRQDICGNCKYFEYKHGQEAIAQQQFGQRLVREEGWKLHHLGAPLETMGLCGQSNGETVTTPFSSCPEFRPRNGRSHV